VLSIFEIVAGLLTLTALFSWLNYRWLGLPSNVGLLIMALFASLALIGFEVLVPDLAVLGQLHSLIEEIDFPATLLNGMLAFLLFAGALQIDLSVLRDRAWSVGAMATFGVVVSTVVIAGAMWATALLLSIALPFAWALVFGALISPTDPIAVLGMLKQAKVAKTLEMDMAGESLFNDGVGVVLFTLLLNAALGMGGEGIDFAHIGQLFFIEALGGGALGLLTGYIAYRAMYVVDDYPIEVLISLALVTATYAVAQQLHVSGPIAVVVAGVLTGNRGVACAMSETTQRYLFGFWNLIDEILNSVLFLLIGLEVLVLQFDPSLAPLAVAAVPIVLMARLLAVGLSVTALGVRERFVKGTIPILTWGGIRGGISVALALSIPLVPEKPLILAATYLVVLFTIVVQGLSFPLIVRRVQSGVAG
jgi:CPA1 family monovalent cation:H+ antiporter